MCLKKLAVKSGVREDIQYKDGIDSYNTITLECSLRTVSTRLRSLRKDRVAYLSRVKSEFGKH